MPQSVMDHETVTADERDLCARLAKGEGAITAALVAAARRHRLHLLVGAGLSAAERDGPPGSTLVREITIAAALNAWHEEAVRTLLDSLGLANLPALLLKGTGLAYTNLPCTASPAACRRRPPGSPGNTRSMRRDTRLVRVDPSARAELRAGRATTTLREERTRHDRVSPRSSLEDRQPAAVCRRGELRRAPVARRLYPASWMLGAHTRTGGRAVSCVSPPCGASRRCHRAPVVMGHPSPDGTPDAG